MRAAAEDCVDEDEETDHQKREDGRSGAEDEERRLKRLPGLGIPVPLDGAEGVIFFCTDTRL